jgi:hypothetical protein
VHHLEDFTTLLDKVVYGTLADPITPDYVRDVKRSREEKASNPQRSKASREDGPTARWRHC